MDLKELSGQTDEELTQLSLESQNAFAVLVKRYQSRLTAFIMKISNFTQAEIDDILQEVFIKVYHNLNSFDSQLKFSSWIYRITRNQTINHYRKTKTKINQLTIYINDEVLNNLADDFDLNNSIDKKLLRLKINQALAKLDIKYREVLVLRFFEGKDYKEISDILKKPKGTIATLINRAKKNIKKFLVI